MRPVSFSASRAFSIQRQAVRHFCALAARIAREERTRSARAETTLKTIDRRTYRLADRITSFVFRQRRKERPSLFVEPYEILRLAGVCLDEGSTQLGAFGEAAFSHLCLDARHPQTKVHELFSHAIFFRDLCRCHPGATG
jgi:hypothetical protein